ncbi:MAG TPA: leucine-rich repeat protein [Candidatus Gordonibacter avicola]|nr:leucine-rich repeat protein [Candidatus Gordonibacter avicola]
MDRMLFSKDYSHLLLIPEGKEGAVTIPGSTKFIPALAFSRCQGSSLTAGDGSTTFATQAGMLFSKDMKTLIVCPPKVGAAVVVPLETETIGEYALAGCKDLTSITALGNVREIDATAFADEVKSSVVVALPAGEDYNERKAVWEAAGFEHFAEPAELGATAHPEVESAASGLVFTLLDDYTLSVSWEGAEDPASDFEIPASAKINGVSYRVSTIATNAFANRGSLTSVKLPAGITTIGEAAFAGCANLASVSLPGTLQHIDERAFEATSLADIWLPASVQSINSRAFASCEALTRIVAFNTPEVAEDALATCTNVSIYCPYNEAGSYPWNLGLLANNNHLMPYGLTLPEEPLTLEVGQQANLFEDGLCEAPSPVELSFSYAAKPLSVDEQGTTTAKAEGTSEVTAVLSLDTHELTRATRAVEVVASSSEATTSQTTTEPADEQPEAETLPTYDTTLALQEHTTASGLSVLSGTVSLLAENGIFDYEYEGARLRYQIIKEPNGDTPGTCRVLGKSYSMVSLSGVDLVIPDIAIDASNGNAQYKVTETGNYAFNGADIASLKLPQTLEYMTGCAFGNNYNLKEVLIPKSVTSMGFNPFMVCKSLTKIEVEEGNPSFTAKDGVIYSKDMTTLIGGTPATITGRFLIPEGVKAVNVNSMSACVNVTYLYIPKSVSNFGQGYNIITGLTNLAEIDIDPANEWYAISDGLLYKKANGVPTVLIGGTPKSTPDVPVIPNTVTQMSKSAFSQRRNITSIIMPPSVTRVSANVFYNCISLDHAAVLSQERVTFDTAVFSNCTSLRELLITSPDPLFKNTEGPEQHTIFQDIDTSFVTLHCPSEAVEFWESYGVNAVPFSTGVPSFIGLPNSRNEFKRMFTPSIPENSAFGSNIRLVHEFSHKDGDISVYPDQTGCAVMFKYTSGGSGTLTSKLVYNDGTNGDIVLAESTSTVQTSPTSGALPTAADANNTDEEKASWSLSEMGVLTIRSTDPVGDFGWSPDNPLMNSQYWGPLRDEVRIVDTSGLAGATSMACWFKDMRQLLDIFRLSIPRGTKDLSYLLQNCAVSHIPDSLKFPEGVTTVRALFAGNPLTEIPQGFTSSMAGNSTIADCSQMFEGTNLESLPSSHCLPEQAQNASAMFKGTKLQTLPKGFFLPSSLTSMDEMFQSCSRLAYLPESFVLPGSLTSAVGLFEDCINLMCLPEQFTLPKLFSNAPGADKMFSNCKKLDVLPAAFRMPTGFDLTAAPNMFYNYSVDQGLAYSGDDAVILDMDANYWSNQHRTLKVPEDASVTFKLSSRDGSRFDPWTALTPDLNSGKFGEPAVPTRNGQVFTLWYTDEACTQRFDFSKRVDEQLTTKPWVLYGKYVAGTLQGALPTVGNGGTAFWSLDDSGTLYLKGSGSIADLGWKDDGNEEFPTAGYWGPYRQRVTKASLVPSLRAASMAYWFCGMLNLADIAEVFVPTDTKDVTWLFNMRGQNGGSSSFTQLPDTFTFPNGLEKATAAFQNCALEELPSGFSLTDTLVNAESLFAWNTNLKTLPDGVKFGPSLLNASEMFLGCESLTSLPAGFSLEGSTPDITYLFKGCVNLSSLPEGFAFSEGGKKLGVFENCSALSYLPADFTMPKSMVSETRPFFCELSPGEQRIPTYYAGSDPNVLNYDWEGQGRTLITDDAEMGDRGMTEIAFEVQSPDEAAGFPWETRSTAWTNTQRMLADPGYPQRDGYVFSGWCTDEECLTLFDFTKPVPAGATTLYGKWLLGGGFDAKMPLATGTTGDVWWRVTADGTLSIKGAGDVEPIDWTLRRCSEGLWGPYRDAVKRIEIDPGVKCVNLSVWFAHMPNLVDLSKCILPSNAEYLWDLFNDCTGLKEVGSGFRLPTENLLGVQGLFSECTSLEKVSDVVLLPESIKTVNWMFNNCHSLRTLPKGFTIPQNVVATNDMFYNCFSLESLPEGFGYANPENITNVEHMFQGCSKLTSLPASLKITELVNAKNMESMFLLKDEASKANPLKTYYAGDPADMNDTSYWATQNRELVTSVPEGKALATLYVSNDTLDGFEVWTTRLVDVGALEVPEAPFRESATFVNWYTDATCATPFDFTKPVKGNVEMYAKYETNKGLLPTTDGGERASWELADDSTLKIHCAEGAVIDDFGWTLDSMWGGWDSGKKITIVPMEHWGALRSKVQRVQMDKTVRATSMAYWFAGMGSLVDATGIFVPEGVNSVEGLFVGCTNLTELPENLVIPSTVKTAKGMFSRCSSMAALPTNFKIREGVEDVSYMFSNMTSLTALPAAFTLPDSVTNVSSFLRVSQNIKSLPAGFNIPPNATEAASMFYECRSLEELPVGFRIPESCLWVYELFYRCSSLKYLPGIQT